MLLQSRPKHYSKVKGNLDLQDRETPFLPGRTRKYKAGGRLPCQVLLNQGKQRMTQTINEITGRRVSSLSEITSTIQPTVNADNWQEIFFFLIAGCNGSLGYWQSLATRESNKQHQWYCVPKESQVPIHYDLSHHNLCMTERMVHKREKRHNNTRKTKARRHQPTPKTNTHNQTQNNRRHRGET